MDHLQALRLPSMAKFNAGFMYCNQSSEKQCGGPSKQNYEQRLTKAVQMAGCALSSNGSGGTVHYKVHFVKNGGAWILFIFLDTYTRMFWTVRQVLTSGGANSLGRGSLDPDEFYMGNSYNLHNCIVCDILAVL
uniref:Uncharacterized protein n=1 Tax=Brassica oleracea var. oleracea TaxID=109376 RepID=A0A0D3C5D4_BRAOL